MVVCSLRPLLASSPKGRDVHHYERLTPLGNCQEVERHRKPGRALLAQRAPPGIGGS